jgi:hypothetical protein
MLEEEMKWLDTAINSQEVAPGDSVTGSLLAGHLKLIATLFTCHGVNKRKRPGLVQQLLDDFLFPASTVMLQRTGTSIPSSSSRHPVRQRSVALIHTLMLLHKAHECSIHYLDAAPLSLKRLLISCW